MMAPLVALIKALTELFGPVGQEDAVMTTWTRCSERRTCAPALALGAHVRRAG